MVAPTLRLLAPAKVNLTFEALGRREDGYHEVRTILQAIDLADEIAFEPAGELTLEVEPPGAAPIEGNLALAAARLLRREVGVAAGAALRLLKRIPTAAGLGGGSSDAAAALLGLRRLWGIDVGGARLLELASRLGSDAPFFIAGGTALAAGRGERLSPLPSPVERFAVVAFSPGPELGDKTARMYGLLGSGQYSDGGTTTAVVRRLREGAPLGGGLINAFEAVAWQPYDAYERTRALFRRAGAERPMLCGAGPSLFALADDEAVADEMRERLEAGGCRAFAARLMGPWPLAGVSAG